MRYLGLTAFLFFFSGCGTHNPLPSDPVTGYMKAPVTKTLRPAPEAKKNKENAVPDSLQSTRGLVQSVKHDGSSVMFVLNERIAHGTWPNRTYYHPVYTVREKNLVDEAGESFMIRFQDYLLVHWYEKDGERLVWSVRVLRMGRGRKHKRSHRIREAFYKLLKPWVP